MNRKQTTSFLSDLLKRDKFKGISKYWASEVTFDYGTKQTIRLDFVQFVPEGVFSISQLEHGKFYCYEVKSCKADFHSGFGQNYIGEFNYLVMTMNTYKECIHEIPHDVGVLVAVPYVSYTNRRKIALQEFENPTQIDGNVEHWCLACICEPTPKIRQRSMTEMLFCMLRAGH